MTTVLVLKHFNSIREAILKMNFLNYVNDEVLSQYWCSELKCTDILIKIFIDYLNLKYFMTIKELIRRQTKWTEKLFEYNFKIIYQSRKQNLKVDVLIRMSDVKSVEANDDRKLYQHQMLLSEDRFELQSIKADQEDDQKAEQDLTQNLTQIWNMNWMLTKIWSKRWFLFRIKL